MAQAMTDRGISGRRFKTSIVEKGTPAASFVVDHVWSPKQDISGADRGSVTGTGMVKIASDWTGGDGLRCRHRSAPRTDNK